MATDPTRPPEDQDKARNRFMVINLMRIGGVAMILFGIAVLQGVFALPEWIAYIVIVLGLAETFVMPQVLARAWSSNRK
jgi:hypothetical protein